MVLRSLHHCACTLAMTSYWADTDICVVLQGVVACRQLDLCASKDLGRLQPWGLACAAMHFSMHLCAWQHHMGTKLSSCVIQTQQVIWSFGMCRQASVRVMSSSSGMQQLKAINRLVPQGAMPCPCGLRNQALDLCCLYKLVCQFWMQGETVPVQSSPRICNMHASCCLMGHGLVVESIRINTC